MAASRTALTLCEAAVLMNLDAMRAALVRGERSEQVSAAIVSPTPNPVEAEAFQLAALALLRQYGALDATDAFVTSLALRQSPTVVRWLLDAGANIRPASLGAPSALFIVRRADVARVLLAAGCDVNAMAATHGARSGTPLHACMRSCDKEAAAVAAVLVEVGADVNACDPRRQTPLHAMVASPTMFAAQRLQLARLLLNAGADPAAEDLHGVTPLAAALAHLKMCVRRRARTPVAELAQARSLVVMLAPAAAWCRRRHMLLAVRGRYATSAAADAGAADATGGAGAP